MFAVKGWNVQSSALKTQTEAIPNIAGDKSKKRKRNEKGAATPQVTDGNVGDLWEQTIDGKKPRKAPKKQKTDPEVKDDEKKEVKGAEKASDDAAPKKEPKAKGDAAPKKEAKPKGDATPKGDAKPKGDSAPKTETKAGAEAPSTTEAPAAVEGTKKKNKSRNKKPSKPDSRLLVSGSTIS